MTRPTFNPALAAVAVVALMGDSTTPWRVWAAILLACVACVTLGYWLGAGDERDRQQTERRLEHTMRTAYDQGRIVPADQNTTGEQVRVVG